MRWRGAPGMAMTGKAGAGTPGPTGVGRGIRIAAPVCELARNDRRGGRGTGGHKGRPYGGNRRPVVGAAHWAARIAHQTCGGLFAPMKTQLLTRLAGSYAEGRQPELFQRKTDTSCNGFQVLPSLANRTAARTYPRVQGAAGRALKMPVPPLGPSFRPLSSRRKGTRRRPLGPHIPKYRPAWLAAMAPSAAAVTSCRSSLARQSPAA